MAEQDLGAPEGNYEGWTEGKSDGGQTFYYRAVDSEGKTAKKSDLGEHEVDAHGPPFNNLPCNWTANTSGSTDVSFANQTGITWYSLQNTVGWTYQLTINTTQTYDYTFTTPNDSYTLDVWATSHTHEVTYTTYNPTVTGVSGK